MTEIVGRKTIDDLENIELPDDLADIKFPVNINGQTVSITGEQFLEKIGINLPNKANIDGSNITESFFLGAILSPNTIDYITESFSDTSGNWYRKYKSGWIEQGGLNNSAAGNVTINFLVPFSNPPLFITTQENSSTAGTNSNGQVVVSKTNSNFVMNHTAPMPILWEAKGF